MCVSLILPPLKQNLKRVASKTDEVKADPAKIPCVYSVHKQLETFKIPVVKREPAVIMAQLCFVLDYTGSMKEQINQAESSCRKIVDAVKGMAFDHMPGATVDLEMAAIGYNDWDEETAKRNRPVVFAYGGSEIKKKHDPEISLTEFNLGGKFTKDTDDMMKWIKQPLGHGGKIPEDWASRNRLPFPVLKAVQTKGVTQEPV